MKILKLLSNNAVIFTGDDLVLTATGTTGAGYTAPMFTTANAVINNAPDLPAGYIGGCWTYINGVWAVLPEAQAQVSEAEVKKLALAKAAAIIKIDADADKIYGDVVGSKGEEYRSAEADAKAFITANYTGTAGSGVTSWATAKGWTNTQAADDILATAAQWRTAQAAIRASRLLRKEQVRAATDSAGITAAMAAWAGFVVAIRGQFGA